MDAATTTAAGGSSLVVTQRSRKFRRFWIFMRRWPVISGSMLVLIIFVAIFATWISPHSPQAHSLTERNVPPFWQEGGSANHILGTDTLGRDLLSRLMYGARITLMVAAISLISGVVIGTGLGLLGGYFGGTTDEMIMRIVDIWLGLPYILVALVISLAVGQGIGTIAVLLTLVAWTPFVRQVRGEVLTLKSREYVMAARVAGAPVRRIFLKHLLPGVMNTIIVIATFQIASLILLEAFLSFLGAGIPPPTPAWGSMISEGRNYLQDAWWISFFPGLAILLTTASFSFLGDWIRDFTDPKLRQLD